jgi:hypothetical protein
MVSHYWKGRILFPNLSVFNILGILHALLRVMSRNGALDTGHGCRMELCTFQHDVNTNDKRLTHLRRCLGHALLLQLPLHFPGVLCSPQPRPLCAHLLEPLLCCHLSQHLLPQPLLLLLCLLRALLLRSRMKNMKMQIILWEDYSLN